MTRTQEEIAKLIEDSWDLYRRIPRVTKMVDIYAAGFAFGTPALRMMDSKRLEPVDYQVAVSAGLLREIGRDLYVAGLARANVEVSGTEVNVTPGGQHEFTYQEPPTGSPPGILWATAVNHDALLQILATPGHPLLAHLDLLITPLPGHLLEPHSASTMTSNEVLPTLHFYKHTVGMIRQQFGCQLADCVGGGSRVLDVSWQPLWDLPGVSPALSLLQVGPVYQVLRGEGIDLAVLRQEAMDMLSELVGRRIIPASQAQGITSSFGP